MVAKVDQMMQVVFKTQAGRDTTQTSYVRMWCSGARPAHLSVHGDVTADASQSGARMLVLFEVTQVTVLMCELDVELGLYKYSE